MSAFAGGIQTIDILTLFYPQSFRRVLSKLDEDLPVTCSWDHPSGPIITFWDGARHPCFDTSYHRPVDMVMEHQRILDSERHMILCANARGLLGLKCTSSTPCHRPGRREL